MYNRIQQLVLKGFHSATLNTWASIAVRALNLVLLLPFILKEFDAAEITLWYLFTIITSFNLVFDMGFSPTFIRAIAYGMGGASSFSSKSTSGQPNILFLKKIWQNIRVVYFFLTLLVLVLLSSLGSWVVFKPINLLANENEGWLSWFFVILGTTLAFWGNIFSIYLQGVNKIAVFRRYETIFGVCSIISSIFIIHADMGFVSLVIVNQFWIIISIIRNLWICHKDSIYVEISSRFSFKIDKELIKEIWETSWRSAIGIVMSFGIINISTILIAQSDDSAATASYLFSLRILQVVINFSMAPFYSKIPLLSKLYVTGDYEELIKIARKSMRFSHLSFVVAAIAIGFSAPYIIQLIHSQVSFIDGKIWSALILAYFAERFGSMHIQLFSITNKIVWHIANSITGIILFLLLYFSIPKFGFYAFPFSMLIAYISFYSWYAAGKSYSYFKINIKEFEVSTSLPALMLILIYLGYSYFF